MGEWMKKIVEKVDEFDIWLAASEAYMKEQLNGRNAQCGGRGNKWSECSCWESMWKLRWGCEEEEEKGKWC